MTRFTTKIALLPVLMLGFLAACSDNTETAAPVEPISQSPIQADQPHTRMAAVKPVMVIRFNQKHVYIKDALAKVVREVSQVRPGAVYQLRSLVPVGMSEEVAEKNLGAVVGELARLGVSAQVSVEPASPVASQEVQLCVR